MTREFEWIPHPLIIDQYKIVLNRFPFTRWILNSVIVTAGTVLLVLVVSLPAGYAFARMNFKGKNFLFTLSPAHHHAAFFLLHSATLLVVSLSRTDQYLCRVNDFSWLPAG